MYVYVCMYIRAHIHITCIWIPPFGYLLTCKCMHAYTDMKYQFIVMCTFICACSDMKVYAQATCICVHVLICTYMCRRT